MNHMDEIMKILGQNNLQNSTHVRYSREYSHSFEIDCDIYLFIRYSDEGFEVQLQKKLNRTEEQLIAYIDALARLVPIMREIQRDESLYAECQRFYRDRNKFASMV